MPDLFNQIILALVAVGIVLIIANKFVKASTNLEDVDDVGEVRESKN